MPKKKAPGPKTKALLSPEERLIPVCVRLTPAQKQKLLILGGGPWLRERLRRTTVSL